MKLLLLPILIFVTAIVANAQSTTPTANPCAGVTMPAGTVCLSVGAARAALEAGDRAEAAATENKALKDAIEAYKKEINEMRIAYAEAKGENTALKQNAVDDRALIQVLVQYARPKVVGLKIF